MNKHNVQTIFVVIFIVLAVVSYCIRANEVLYTSIGCIVGMIFGGIYAFYKNKFRITPKDKNFLVEGLTKGDKYYEFLSKYKDFISGETEEISVMANTAAALREAFGFFWVGFYIVKGDRLILGPFQGFAACSYIRYGKGVCGTAWEKKATQVVPDVDKFPGHIACSSASRSEIVVPVMIGEEVRAVLDIDSDKLNAFDEVDKTFLEKIIAVMVETLYKV